VTSYRALHEGWTLSGADHHGVPATVPGCVHTDLLAAGLIEDPYLDDNETKLAWIGRTAWDYETTFSWTPADGRTDLVCAGLDTVATVTLNGVELGRTENMHRGYRFDARSALRSGDNTLRVHFDPAYGYAESHQERLGDLPNAYPEPFPFIRKMACNFGWDWGPTLVTAGIWQDIGLHTWSVARLAEVRPQVTVEDGVGRVDVHLTLERDTDGPVTVVAAVAGREAVARISGREAVLSVAVDDPELWWPRGYGEQPRYDLDVTLSDSYGKLDVWSRRIGFRDLRLDTRDGAFTVVVNGRPVMARGVNWIPDDVFVTRVDRDRLTRRLTQAVEANVNYVRVWGGGRYESGTSTTSATSTASWCSRTSRSRARPTPRRSRSPPRSPPRPGRTWCASARTRAWCCGPATTRTSGATRTGTGSPRWPARRGARATTSRSCPA
jgi:beta-mannosidase